MRSILSRNWFKKSIHHWHIRLSVFGLILSLVLGACASTDFGNWGPRYLYGFYYNAVTDMRDIKILGCEYLTARPNYGIRCGKFDGEPFQRTGEAHYLYYPSTLYVNWVDLKTNKTYEAKAELKAGIPKGFRFENLSDIAFVCDGDLLEVFLVSKEEKPSDWPKAGPYILQKNTGEKLYLYDLDKVYTIASIKGKLM
jgi:hypothetical protein